MAGSGQLLLVKCGPFTLSCDVIGLWKFCPTDFLVLWGSMLVAFLWRICVCHMTGSMWSAVVRIPAVFGPPVRSPLCPWGQRGRGTRRGSGNRSTETWLQRSKPEPRKCNTWTSFLIFAQTIKKTREVILYYSGTSLRREAMILVLYF